MSAYEKLQSELKASPAKWLVTGVAGFIGSNLLEELLKLDQSVVGLDNFSTGKQANLEEVSELVSPAQWSRFRFLEGDLTDLATCERACAGMDFVLHQAAIGSVPRSLLDPLRYHHSNVTGFLNLLVAARDARVKRFVYASSSSVYGDHPDLPKVEDKTGTVLSPYAATKAMGETYADVFARGYGMATVGLRYFNVFGPRQDPDGAYAAVIPKWIAAMLKGEQVVINGDGETSRDFCFIANVVQANLLAATAPGLDSVSNAQPSTLDPQPATAAIYNIAVGERTTLNELYRQISVLCPPSSTLPSTLNPQPRSQPSTLTDSALRTPHSVLATPPLYLPFRPGDVRHSLADISKAQRLLGYEPTHRIRQGLNCAMDWYRSSAARRRINTPTHGSVPHKSSIMGDPPMNYACAARSSVQ